MVSFSQGNSFEINQWIGQGFRLFDHLCQFNISLLPKQDYLSYREKLIVLDHRISRTFELVSVWIFLLPPLTLALLAFIVQSYKFGYSNAILYAALTAEYSVVVNSFAIIAINLLYILVTDKWSRNRLKQSLENYERDTLRENRFLNRIKWIWVSYLSIFGALLIYFDLNTLLRTTSTASATESGPNQGEVIFLDMRARCQGCKHSVRAGDLVVGLNKQGEYFAKVDRVALESKAACTGNSSGRNLASFSPRTAENVSGSRLPGENTYTVVYLTVLGKEASEQKTVCLSQLKGRVLKNFRQFFEE